MKTSIKIPVCAVVVTKNEARYLERCLRSISFCEEIVVIDLQSTDESVAIARACNARVVSHDPVPVVEHIHAEISAITSSKWVMITDPDEVASEELADFLVSNASNFLDDPEIGEVRTPIQYYVGERKLKGTVWGWHSKRTYIVHQDRFRFTKSVHGGRKLLPGFRQFVIERTGDRYIHHFWVESLRELKNKFYGQYLKFEGKSRYDNKRIPTLLEIMINPFRLFYLSFFAYKGFKDGLLGFRLSVFYAVYQTLAMIEAFRYAGKHS